MNFDRAKTIASHIMYNIKGLYITGSIKRKEDFINDIDFITKRDLNDILLDFDYFYNIEVKQKGNDYMRLDFICSYGNINIDIWKANDNYEYKFLKWMRNLDKGHNIYYRKLAKDKGLILSDRGLKNGNVYLNINTKENLIKALK